MSYKDIKSITVYTAQWSKRNGYIDGYKIIVEFNDYIKAIYVKYFTYIIPYEKLIIDICCENYKFKQNHDEYMMSFFELQDAGININFIRCNTIFFRKKDLNAWLNIAD